MKFCANCGRQILDGEQFCSGCGTAVSGNNGANVVQPEYVLKRKIPGRGFGISSMVLGIIGIVYGVVSFVSAVRAINNAKQIEQIAESGEWQMPITFLVLGVLSLCFAPAAFRKGYKNGVSVSGLVLGLLTTILCAVALIIMLSIT